MQTDSCRERLKKYCVGNGLDIGFGGHPILPSAISLDRAEGHPDRAKSDHPAPTHLVGDAANLYWFKDCVLDYVYSSHCLEDFTDTAAVLNEWLRVIRHGGLLVLFLPDQPTYVRYEEAAGRLPNQAHKHADFSLEFVRRILSKEFMIRTKEVYSAFPLSDNAYSFDLVVERI